MEGHDYAGVELVPWTPSYKALPKVKAPKRMGRPTNVSKGLPPPNYRPTPDETRADNRTIFRAAIVAWTQSDRFLTWEEVGENAYLVTLADRRKSLQARDYEALALLLPGQIGPLPDNSGVLWMNGGGGPHGWILTQRGQVRSAEEAQSVYLNLVPVEERDGRLLPWTMGGIAGKLLNWTGVEQQSYREAEVTLRHPDGHAHRRAIRGVYPDMVQWDVSGYHYELLRRLPSPVIHPMFGDSIDFPSLEPQERERWDTVVNIVAPYKSLRNALVGKMGGSRKLMTNYTRDKVNGGVKLVPHWSARGKQRPGHLLIIRAAHELTQLQSLGAESVWSHTDAVIIPPGQEPTLWQAKGFTVQRLADGPTRILDTINYKCGERIGGDTMRMLEAVGGEVYDDPAEEDEAASLGACVPEVQYHRTFI